MVEHLVIVVKEESSDIESIALYESSASSDRKQNSLYNINDIAGESEVVYVDVNVNNIRIEVVIDTGVNKCICNMKMLRI